MCEILTAEEYFLIFILFFRKQDLAFHMNHDFTWTVKTFSLKNKNNLECSLLQIAPDTVILGYHIYPIGTDRPNQTVKTQIVESDQGLQCLPLIQQFSDILRGSKMDLFQF